MDKTAKKKESLLCYFHFMFNEWNERKASQVFANAPCGWQYLWQKWIRFCEEYGQYGAVTMYYTEGLDKTLQTIIAKASYDFYNG